jgi:hypothetical protein
MFDLALAAQADYRESCILAVYVRVGDSPSRLRPEIDSF